MRRGILVFVLLTTVLGVGHFAQAQQPRKIPLIGFLIGTSLSSVKPRIELFRQSLRDLKYIDGQNISIAWRSADGVDERLPNLAVERPFGIQPTRATSPGCKT
jgi:putative ABC transport system substrate-binding protein